MEKVDLLTEYVNYVKSTLAENKEKAKEVDMRLEGNEIWLVRLENSTLSNA